MGRYLIFEGEEAEFKAELDEGPTAEEIWNSLPLEAGANLWGDEIYFSIPVSMQPEPEARETVEVGDVAYWPQGSALCIFFGPTPASTDDKPRAASAVTVVGRVVEGLENARRVGPSETLRVRAAEE